MKDLNVESVKNSVMLMDFGISENGYKFASNIETALAISEDELSEIVSKISENSSSLKKLTPECDKTDYILSACIGALCGIMDIFLVGKPGESPIGNLTDKWYAERTKMFAKMCGWDSSKDNSLSSAIGYLEEKFKIPYDQTGAGDAARDVFGLNPKSHHFKSLGHNPSIVGLYFSILNQFTNSSHFVTGGELISLQDADGHFELKGNNVPSKLFCGFVNWYGHLISDRSGSSSSKGRGMGIPSPFWTWTNDLIVIKRKLHIPVSEFDKAINELALEIYKKGYDARFQSAQTIPVLVNEALVRIVYSIRRLLKYYATTEEENRSFSAAWESCKPFGNATIKRMLLVAHGTFCLVDAGDAVARGFIAGDVPEFIMRLNIVGIARFGISLYGEGKSAVKRHSLKNNILVLSRERTILADYIEGLQCLAEIYDDGDLLQFTNDLKNSDMYIQAFEKSAALAEKRSVPQEKILKNKADIDSYFNGEEI